VLVRLLLLDGEVVEPELLEERDGELTPPPLLLEREGVVVFGVVLDGVVVAGLVLLAGRVELEP
jgi:hypothetical protein